MTVKDYRYTLVCDRCGREEERGQDREGDELVTVWKGDIGAGCQEFDLCDPCMDELMRWLGKEPK